MGRSLKKGPYVDFKVYRKVQQQQESGTKEPIKTWARACTIVPEFVGTTFLVHNGKQHLKVFVTEDMVGHRLGEFAPTRTFRAIVAGENGNQARTVKWLFGLAIDSPASTLVRFVPWRIWCVANLRMKRWIS
jgi:small subunit ribosomal protein S19